MAHGAQRHRLHWYARSNHNIKSVWFFNTPPGAAPRDSCFCSTLKTGLKHERRARQPGQPQRIHRQRAGADGVSPPQTLQLLNRLQVLELIPSSTSKIVFLPCPHDDPTQRKPDITGARAACCRAAAASDCCVAVAGQKLGWAPAIQIKEV